MNDVNYIKGQLQSWRKCINWLNVKYPEKLFELEHQLENLKGISYEEKQGGSGIDESMRRSIINDKITKLEKKKRHCEAVIEFCEDIIQEVKPQYRDVFIYKYSTHATMSWIAYRLGIEEDTIYKNIDRETERIANE